MELGGGQWGPKSIEEHLLGLFDDIVCKFDEMLSLSVNSAPRFDMAVMSKAGPKAR